MRTSEQPPRWPEHAEGRESVPLASCAQYLLPAWPFFERERRVSGMWGRLVACSRRNTSQVTCASVECMCDRVEFRRFCMCSFR